MTITCPTHGEKEAVEWGDYNCCPDCKSAWEETPDIPNTSTKLEVTKELKES